MTKKNLTKEEFDESMSHLEKLFSDYLENICDRNKILDYVDSIASSAEKYNIENWKNKSIRQIKKEIENKMTEEKK